jgi:hypothetical protein
VQLLLLLVVQQVQEEATVIALPLTCEESDEISVLLHYAASHDFIVEIYVKVILGSH